MVMLTETSTQALQRERWVEEWGHRIHVAQAIVLWLRARRDAADPPTRGPIASHVSRVESELVDTCEHYQSVRQAPLDRWTLDADGCERAFRSFVVDSNRALARFK